MTDKERFLQIAQNDIKRNGIDKLLNWLCSTDFFEAPASTKFHNAIEGGLCDHSLNVYDVFKRRYDDEEAESVAIVTLLHDVCKAGFYTVSYRNQKNDRGEWEKVPYYTVDDKFPFGHGEKSVFLIERFMKLKPDEAMAIRWHMGGFDDAVKGGSFAISGAFSQFPLAVKMHISDIEATYLVENR